MIPDEVLMPLVPNPLNLASEGGYDIWDTDAWLKSVKYGQHRYKWSEYLKEKENWN